MAVTINASTTTGLVQSADTSGIIQLQSNGTTAVTIDTNQRAAFVAGTAALPAITTTGDTNTGIFFSAADTIDFTEGGAATGQFDSSGNFKFNSGYGSVATAFGCRAWVNFDGTTNTGGFCTIRGSGNVTTVADNGTGDYTVNFTTAMPDVNYAVGGVCVGSTSNSFSIITGLGGSVINTGSVRFGVMSSAGGTAQDYSSVSIQIFR